ncbi:MAG TPA: hypothetical protein VM686_28715 [Polyangiaceae bacterium]|nr:hypothetical protein [Polyangiaceae bacterium]
MDRAELRAAVLAASNPAPVSRDVPGLGKVFVIVQTAYTADIAREKLQKHQKDDRFNTGRTLATILCDADGEPLFDVADLEDVAALTKLRSSAISAILAAANEVNSVDVPEGSEPGKA